MKRRLSQAQAPPSALPVLSAGAGSNSTGFTPKKSSPAVLRFKRANSQIPSFLPLSAKTFPVTDKDRSGTESAVSAIESTLQAGPDLGTLQASPASSIIAPTRLPRRSSLKHAARRSLSKSTTLTLASATPPRKAYARRESGLPRHNGGTLRSRLPARSSPASPTRTLQLHLPPPTTPAFAKPSVIPDRPSKKTRVLRERNANDADTDPPAGASSAYPTPPRSATRPSFPFRTREAWSESGSSTSDAEEDGTVWEAVSADSRRSVSSSYVGHAGSATASSSSDAERDSDRDEDEDDEDPFFYDRMLAAPTADPVRAAATVAGTAVDDDPSASASAALRRISLAPIGIGVGGGAARYSLTRTQTADGTVFTREIAGADGRRWSLCVPARGLPEDMIAILDELERLAGEFARGPVAGAGAGVGVQGEVPRIVVTRSASVASVVGMVEGGVGGSGDGETVDEWLLRVPEIVEEEEEEEEEEDVGIEVGSEGNELSDAFLGEGPLSSHEGGDQDTNLGQARSCQGSFGGGENQELQTSISAVTAPSEPQPNSTPSQSAIQPLASDSSLQCIFIPDLDPELLARPRTPLLSTTPSSPILTPSPSARSIRFRTRLPGSPSASSPTRLPGPSTSTPRPSNSENASPSTPTSTAAKGKSALPVLRPARSRLSLSQVQAQAHAEVQEFWQGTTFHMVSAPFSLAPLSGSGCGPPRPESKPLGSSSSTSSGQYPYPPPKPFPSFSPPPKQRVFKPKPKSNLNLSPPKAKPQPQPQQKPQPKPRSKAAFAGLRPKSASVPAPHTHKSPLPLPPSRSFRSRFLFRRPGAGAGPVPAQRRTSEPPKPKFVNSAGAGNGGGQAGGQVSMVVKSRIGRPRPVSYVGAGAGAGVGVGAGGERGGKEAGEMRRGMGLARLPSARDLLRRLK